jgi:hypothetical protein
MRPESHSVLARAALVAGICLLSAGLSSCVSFNWSRHRMYRPLPKNAIVGLEPGSTKLDACIERLGAPLYVWEYKIEGAALAWGKGDAQSKRVAVSIPIKSASPTVSYGDIDANVRGVVLLFDKDLVLEQVKQGYLRAIARGIAQPTRAAPAATPPPGASPVQNPVQDPSPDPKKKHP